MGEVHYGDHPGMTWVGGHLVARPDNAASRVSDEQGARAALAREIERGGQMAGTNSVSIRRYGGNLSEDTTQHFDHPDRVAARQLPPDSVNAGRRSSADLARAIGSSQQLSGSSTVSRDPREEETFYTRRAGGVLAVGHRYVPHSPPVDWSSFVAESDEPKR